MKKNSVAIIQGDQLNAEMVSQLNEVWVQEFKKDKAPLDSNKREEFKDEWFFILQNDKDGLLALGRLRPIDIELLHKTYSVMGIASITARIKGKGYGKEIMLAMKDWLGKNNQIGIGFCEPEISEFYRKCGYKVFPGLTKRFWYINSWTGKRESYNSDTLYWAKDDSLINTILTNPDEKILIPYPW